MEEHLYFNFQVDQDALQLIIKCVSKYLEDSSGIKLSEQQDLETMLIELNKAALELQFIEDGL